MSVLKLNLCTLKSAHLKSLNVQIPYSLRLPIRRCSSLRAVRSLHNPPSFTPPPSELESSISSNYTASVGSSFLPQVNFTRRHIVVLNVIACSVAVSATWLFVSAIPTLLAFKRAAESLEKLMDATREELPDTMAAIRLSGMEISDLTMELSDLGQEITQGVKSSTRAVRVAEERLRGLANMTQPSPTASLQRVPRQRIKAGGLVVAKTARGIKESIVKGRMIFRMFFTLVHYSRIALNYFRKQAKKQR